MFITILFFPKRLSQTNYFHEKKKLFSRKKEIIYMKGNIYFHEEKYLFS